MVLPGNIYVIIMPKDTPECTELHHLKRFFSPKPPSNLMYRNTSHSLKNYMFEYGFALG